MKTVYQIASASLLAFGLSAASGTAQAQTGGCTGTTTITNGKPVTTFPAGCTPPTTTPIPSNPSTPIHNAANSTAHADADAQANANVKTEVKTEVRTGDMRTEVKTGEVRTEVKTGEVRTEVKTGEVRNDLKSGDVKGGDVTIGGSYYKASSAGAYAPGVYSASGHGCFRVKAGGSAGVQTVAGGLTGGYSGGTEYETKQLTFTNSDGTTRTVDANPCAADQAGFMVIANGQNPNATKGEKKLAVATAMNMSPAVNRAFNDVVNNKSKELNELFGEDQPNQKPNSQASAGTTLNLYPTVVVDQTGKVIAANKGIEACPKGTTAARNQDGTFVTKMDQNGNVALVCNPY